MKRLFLLMLLIFPFVGSVAAQSQPPKEDKAQSFVFEFVEGKDMFFVPYGGNDVTLAQFVQLIEDNRELLSERKMYISVASYATQGNEEQTAQEVAHIQRNRVKSELITKGGVTEDAFATDRYIAEPYDGLKNVVVVTIPASLETIERLLGASAAEGVKAYYQELESAQQPMEDMTVSIEVADIPEEKNSEPANTQKPIEEDAADTPTEQSDAQPVICPIKPRSTLNLRTNLLYLAGGLLNAGVEYKATDSNIGYLINAGYAPLAPEDWKKKIGGWFLAPEVRYYFPQNDSWFLGAQLLVGGYNVKLSDTGYQGTMIGGGIVGGYKLSLSECLDMDFSLGLGYGSLKYDSYIYSDMGNNLRTGTDIKKNTIMPIQAGVSLIWKL